MQFAQFQYSKSPVFMNVISTYYTTRLKPNRMFPRTILKYVDSYFIVQDYLKLVYVIDFVIMCDSSILHILYKMFLIRLLEYIIDCSNISLLLILRKKTETIYTLPTKNKGSLRDCNKLRCFVKLNILLCYY